MRQPDSSCSKTLIEALPSRSPSLGNSPVLTILSRMRIRAPWETARTFCPRYLVAKVSNSKFARASSSARLSPPGTTFVSAYFARHSSCIIPSASPKDRSRRRGSITASANPLTSATISAVALALDRGEVRIKSHSFGSITSAASRAWDIPVSFRGMSVTP